MAADPQTARWANARGFSLAELMIATAVLLLVSATVSQALLSMTKSQQTIANRTALHAGVRSATELLQQEIGQAGRVALPGTTTLANAIAAGALSDAIKINGTASVSGIFIGEFLTVDGGSNAETVQVTAVDTTAKTISVKPVDPTGTVTPSGATGFALGHAAGASVNVYGGFASGIIPPYTNGSDATHLKLFGDINGDGSMVYVEYTCDTTNGYLYRNQMAYDATSKPAVTASQVLLGNLTSNPGNTACFTYMPSPLPTVAGFTDPGCTCTQQFVLDVAVTLTVQTQQKDPTTQLLQTETKALLNVSPRNVFDTWELASANLGNRVQPTPPTVQALMP